MPELWLGDFDSAPAGLDPSYGEVPRKVFPQDKDKTDGALALEEAVALGAQRIVLAGAFGGQRSDHAHLHMAAALMSSEQTVEVVLSSGYEEAVPLVRGYQSHDLPDGTLFSVLGFTDLAGLTVTGAKWPLKDQNVPFGSSLTLSNEVRGSLTTELAGGRAVLIARLDTV
jgi:thiamine pyrophosphokinase